MHDFNGIEERILKYWEDHDVFRKSVQSRKGKKPFVFFEGPPTANAAPAIHHFIGRVFKDVIPRYQTMRGRYVLRKGGWDTHGLPVELQVEKALGFKSKKDIESYGVAEFNRRCRESVWKNKEEWERFTRRIGFWIDLRDPYITYETPYIESLWHIIRQFWERHLLYQAHRVVPFCTRCGTPLSSHEVNLGYKTATDTSVTLKFKVKSSKLRVDGKPLPKNTFILAWTTTPWTLPGNVALAVGAGIRYVLAQRNGEHFIVAEEVANKVLGAPLAIEATFAGKELVGTSYEPLFTVRVLKNPKSYKVYEADFVTTTDGTGVVHTAVMYGEDDYHLGDMLGLPKKHTVNERGLFEGVSRSLDGKYVKAADTEAAILAQLQERGLLLSTAPYEHEYPFCWRCDTPLLYYAKDSWFVRMSAVNRELLANNETVTWVPAHLKHGRFGQWLKEGKDWAFSRERYWGTPLPIWRSKDGKQMLVVSSLADLDTYRSRKPNTYWLMRHGEAQQNLANTIDSGKEEYHLTERGRKQVEMAAKKLKTSLARKRKRIDIIIASPVLRTRETADIAAKILGKKAVTDERIREIKLGYLQDCHYEAYHRDYPTYESKFTQRPAGGESLSDLETRVWGLVKELEEKYEGRNILIVGHEYPLWMFADAARGWTMDESIVEKEKRGDEFISLAEVQPWQARNLPRDDRGDVDPHRPYIDQVLLKKGGKLLRRIPELCDVWFDSGAMPFAQWHWPFENEDVFRSQYPADFIAEGIDQTRGWFYTLLAVSTALGKGAPYRTVMSYSHVLDEKGQKMSKSKGNVVAPADVIDAVGVDAARWYFYTVNNPGDPKMFNMKDVRERLTGFMGTFHNCLQFHELYRESVAQSPKRETRNVLDEWVLSRLAGLTDVVTRSLDRYDLTAAARAIESFVVDDFSQWWLRRSRTRPEALTLLADILRRVALLTAPFIPFTAEHIWLKLGEEGSVHLAAWPDADRGAGKPELEEEMHRVREAVSAGLALRKQEGIRVRQPLASVALVGQPLDAGLEELVKEELNVKTVAYDASELSLDMTISPALRAEGWAREAARAIQEMRKEVGCKVGDKVSCAYRSVSPDVISALQKHAAAIIRDAKLSQFVGVEEGSAFDLEREFELGPGAKLWLGIRK